MLYEQVSNSQADNCKISKKTAICGTSMKLGISIVLSIKFDFRYGGILGNSHFRTKSKMAAATNNCNYRLDIMTFRGRSLTRTKSTFSGAILSGKWLKVCTGIPGVGRALGVYVKTACPCGGSGS